MSFHSYLSEEIDETDSEVQILNVVMRQNVEKEANELEKIETFFEILAKKLNNLYMMFFHAKENVLSIVFFEESNSYLILKMNDFIDEYFAERSMMLSISFLPFFDEIVLAIDGCFHDSVYSLKRK